MISQCLKPSKTFQLKSQNLKSTLDQKANQIAFKTTAVYEKITHQENNLKKSAGIRACVSSEENTQLTKIKFETKPEISKSKGSSCINKACQSR